MAVRAHFTHGAERKAVLVSVMPEVFDISKPFYRIVGIYFYIYNFVISILELLWQYR